VRAEYLSFFMSPCCPKADLTFVGARDDEKLVRGQVFARGRYIACVDGGVLSFPRSVTNWSTNDLKRLWESGGIARCWNMGIQNGTRNRHRRLFCEALASTSGVILEIGAGPGGGNLAPVLSLNPEARVIVNDLSPQILDLWRRFLAKKRPNSDLCFAAFDARQQVIRSFSLSAVSSCGGIGGIVYTCSQSNAAWVARKALLAAARALRPGGVFFLNEFVINPDDWFRLS
jgi:SAM-dependent methyltransferase